MILGRGTKGDNGYVHIAWCNTSDNSDNSFTISNTDGKEYAYIGTYTDNTSSDSTTFSTYTWVKVKGEKEITHTIQHRCTYTREAHLSLPTCHPLHLCIHFHSTLNIGMKVYQKESNGWYLTTDDI